MKKQELTEAEKDVIFDYVTGMDQDDIMQLLSDLVPSHKLKKFAQELISEVGE